VLRFSSATALATRLKAAKTAKVRNKSIGCFHLRRVVRLAWILLMRSSATPTKRADAHVRRGIFNDDDQYCRIFMRAK
jgi:hypothetical protein